MYIHQSQKNLKFVETLIQNLWWSWRLEAIEVVRRIDPEKWKKSRAKSITYVQ